MTAEEYDVWGLMAAGRIDALTLGRAGTHRDMLEQELALANDSVRVINGRQAITYRYVVPGMLLNDPVFTGLTEQNSTAG